MADAIKCDRCEKFEEGLGVKFSSAGKDLTVCTQCQKEFNEWWGKAKKQD